MWTRILSVTPVWMVTTFRNIFPVSTTSFKCLSVHIPAREDRNVNNFTAYQAEDKISVYQDNMLVKGLWLCIA